ncbi:MAG: sigma-54 dependent transcriptional regulator [Calditrichaceae bacterium]
MEKEKSKNNKLYPFGIYGYDIIGKSSMMLEVYDKIEKVADSATSVIIRGESGTGKELIAKAIHEKSRRHGKPFVALNCAALPENLLESELFGFEKGAFTGAHKTKKGLFETAHQGTVFLDEIGDLPCGLQAKLLRVFQNNEVVHLGGHERIKVDFRLITATHQNLEALIEQKLFRSDLYYRINIFPIYLPALRKRREDIPLLIQHFLKQFPGKRISESAVKNLVNYNYPGNIRELENIITRSALTSGEIIEDVELPELAVNTYNEAYIPDIPAEGINLDMLEKSLLTKALNRSKNNKDKAAVLLGITKQRLDSMLKQFGLEDNYS